MFNVWEMKTPRLIMCIIGGAKYFKLNERLEREFIKGIIQAALKAGKLKKESIKLNDNEDRFSVYRWLDSNYRIQNWCGAISW